MLDGSLFHIWHFTRWNFSCVFPSLPTFVASYMAEGIQGRGSLRQAQGRLFDSAFRVGRANAVLKMTGKVSGQYFLLFPHALHHQMATLFPDYCNYLR